jgi:DNA replication protein DnaC
MSVLDDLAVVLKKCRLSGVLQTLEVRTRQATDDNLSHIEFLYRLLSDEAERRDHKQLDGRLRKANFENQRTLEDFDFLFNPEVPRAKIVDLSTNMYVEKNECILLLGPTGTGKSHLAQAFGNRACRAGHTVLYIAANDMLQQLRASRADGTYDRKLLRFISPKLLIIDDLGLRSLMGDEPVDLYEIVRRRYERAATIITSNRSTEELAQLFGDPLLGSAAMDRLLHHAHVLELVGDSYRNPPPARGRRKGGNSMKGVRDES